MKTKLLPLALVGLLMIAGATAAILRDSAAPSATSLEASAAPEAEPSPEAAAAMAAAADRFLAGLSPEQLEEASFPFPDAERTRFHFVPSEMHPRIGLTIRDMSDAQRTLAHELLQTGLSPGGYLTATAVMELEGILRDFEGPDSRFDRDPDRYYFSIFGTPATDGAWGWRFEGHHMSLNFTIVDGSWVASAPAFLGANPAEVREGPRQGTRILAEREDVARQLLTSLDAAQREVAVIATDAPNDILTGADSTVEPLAPVGIRAAELRPDQRSLLLDLIDVYASLMTEDVATARLVAIQDTGIDDIAFAWAGGSERGDRHYYRIQGPTFLVEFDNTQNDANHIHSVWRDFDGDFGRDILREHLSSVPH